MNLVVPAPWLLEGAPPGEHDEIVVRLLEALAAPGSGACLAAAPGRGKGRVAGAVAARLGEPVVAVCLAGCRSADEARLVLGHALGARPPGDLADVAERLRGLGAPLVVLDRPADRRVAELVDEVGGMVPDARWLLLSEAPLLEEETAQARLPEVPPPLERELRAAGHDPPWDILEDQPAEVLALCWLPGGVRRSDDHVPRLLRRSLADGRVALRPEVIEAVRDRRLSDPSAAAALVAQRLDDELDLALGAPLASGVGVSELLALRWLGEVLRDRDEAPRATAAAARLFTAWGLPREGRRLVRAALRRDTLASPQARALLLWAEAEAALAQGSLSEAEAAWERAGVLLREARDLELLATLTRHRAHRMGERGRPDEAAACWREARLLHRELGDPGGVATTLRGAADLAVARGEVLGAETLYDQAQATPAGALERANRRLGEAALALSRGELQRAEFLLDEADAEHDDDPLRTAGSLRRRAELALRRGAHDDARRLAEEAATSYGEAGEHVARAHTLRLLGDAAAAQGDLAAAAEAFAAAMGAQVRLRDLAGLLRTVRHARALAEDAGLNDLSARLAAHADALEPPGRTGSLGATPPRPGG